MDPRIPKWLELELLAWIQGARTGVLSVRWKDGQAVSIERNEWLQGERLAAKTRAA